jgi:hypothetical protein
MRATSLSECVGQLVDNPEGDMLPATDAELDHIRDYLASEAPDFRVRLLQKVHSESVRGIAQEIWDLHTQKGTAPGDLTIGSSWHDAEAAFLTTSAALDICISTITRQVRQVPDRCPHCTSGRLSTQYGHNPDNPEETCQRPTCEKCGWTGVATRCYPPPPEPMGPPKVAGECSIQTVPLWNLQKPR